MPISRRGVLGTLVALPFMAKMLPSLVPVPSAAVVPPAAPLAWTAVSVPLSVNGIPIIPDASLPSNALSRVNTDDVRVEYETRLNEDLVGNPAA